MFLTRIAALTGGISSQDGDVQAWINAVGAANTTQAEVNALTTYVISGKANGWWTKLDRNWTFALGTQTAALVDLVARATATLPVAPTFTANKGFTGNGTSQYINTGYNPAVNGVKYLQDDASYGGWIQTNDSRTSGNPCYFGSDTHVVGGNNLSRQSATQNNFCVNDAAAGSNIVTMNPTTGTGLNHLERTAAGASALYQNGVSKGTSVDASSGITSVVMLGLASNNGSGTATLFNNGVLASLFTGGSMGATIAAAYYADKHTLMTALSAANFP